MALIKKNKWLRFCKEFNTVNEFRQAEVIVRGRKAEYPDYADFNTFLGLAINTRGESKNEIAIVLSKNEKECHARSIVTVSQPVEIAFESGPYDATQRLTIKGNNGIAVSLSMVKNPQPIYHQIEQELICGPGNYWDNPDNDDGRKAGHLTLQVASKPYYEIKTENEYKPEYH